MRTSTNLTDAVSHRLALRADDYVVAAGERSWTGAALDSAADGVAVELQAAGVGPGGLVAVDEGLGSDLAVAVLGVLRTGAGYVVADVADVNEVARVRATLRPRAWVSHAGRPVPAGDSVVVVDPDITSDPLRQRPVRPNGTPDDVVHAALTSGSTGSPKYVLTPYRALLARLDWYFITHGTEEPLRVLVHKDPRLVGSPVEILTGLVGGVLTPVAREVLQNAEALWHKVRSLEVTDVLASPPVLELLLEGAAGDDGAGSLRIVLTSGQGLTATLARRWLTRFPGVPLLNLYGLSEAGSNVTVYDVRHLPDEAQGLVPVGRPLPGCQVRVVDDELRDVVPGAEGEVLVGGDCVALGYADHDNRPFVADMSAGGTRVFRTGDRGWIDQDGDLRIVGRTDTQLKIRGTKVFPEQVEAALTSLDGIVRAAVVPDGDPLAATDLIAYVESAQRVDLAATMTAVIASLPPASRPSRIVQLEQIPCLPSGKVDRIRVAAIDVPLLAGESLQQSEGAEAGSYQALVRDVWTEVLGRLPELEDDFFEMGGHSLAATRAIALIRARTGIRFPLRLLFEAPVLADFAAAMERHDAAPRPVPAGS